MALPPKAPRKRPARKAPVATQLGSADNSFGSQNIMQLSDADKLGVLWSIADKYYHSDMVRFGDDLATRQKNKPASGDTGKTGVVAGDTVIVDGQTGAQTA